MNLSKSNLAITLVLFCLFFTFPNQVFACGQLHRKIPILQIGPTVYNLTTTTRQYFKFVVERPMTISVVMWPSPDADYDLYGKWTPDALPQGSLAGDPIDDSDFGYGFGGIGQSEAAGSYLLPGTYYIMIHNYSGKGTYDLSIFGLSPKAFIPKTYGWFNNTRIDTSLYVGFHYFLFIENGGTHKFDFTFQHMEDQSITCLRDNVERMHYENNDSSVSVLSVGSSRGTHCIAHIVDKTKQISYLHVGFAHS